MGMVVAARAQGDTETLARLNSNEVALSVRQGENLNRLSHLLTVLMRFHNDPPPALLVSPHDATRAVRAAILVKAIAPQLQARAKAYAVEANEIARQRRLAATTDAATFSEESNSAEDVLPNPLLESAPAVLVPPKWLRPPVVGSVVHRYGETLADGGRANGLTFLAAAKALVKAPGAGQVQYAGPVKGWGVILILKMSGGYHLVLAGMDHVTVSTGQSVEAGAIIGVAGDGSSKAIYLEVRAGNDPVDPSRWMKSGPVGPG
jgi:murein hydrolase activator